MDQRFCICFESSIFIVTTYKTEIYSLYKEIICYREESRTDSLLVLAVYKQNLGCFLSARAFTSSFSSFLTALPKRPTSLLTL